MERNDDENNLLESKQSANTDPNQVKYDPKIYLLDSSTKESKDKTLYILIQMGAWLFYLITGWLSFHWLDKHYMVYTFLRIVGLSKYYYALQISANILWFLTIAQVFTLTIIFCMIFVKIFLKRDDEFIANITTNFNKFYFVPLILNGVLFIIGECSSNKGAKLRDQEISGLIFVILSLASLVYFKILFNNVKYHWTIFVMKKGLFSTLIAYNSYYFFYVICQLVEYKNSHKVSVFKGMAIGIGITMGLIMLAACIVFSDYVISFAYFLIYIGIVAYHFQLTKEYRKSISLSCGEVIIGIIYILLFLAAILINFWNALGNIGGVDHVDDLGLLKMLLREFKKLKSN